MSPKKIYFIKISAKEDCYICTAIAGDPGRTLNIDSATAFNKNSAEKHLNKLIKKYPNRTFNIIEAQMIELK